jgi:thioredoxin-like negative regulator of GroEL
MSNIIRSDNPILDSRQSFKKWLFSQNSKVIVKVSATWCKPCSRIKDLVYQRFARLSNVILVEVDLDKNSDVATSLRVRSVPALISFKEGLPDKVNLSSHPKDVNSFFDNI